MLEQVVEVQSSGLYLHQNRGHMELKAPDGSRRQVDMDGIAVLLLSSPRATLSTALLCELTRRQIPVIVVGSDYLPSAVVQPLGPLGFHVQGQQRVRAQVEMSQPRRKRLWQSVVQAKIRNQACVLELVDDLSGEENRNVVINDLYALAEKVQSGDRGACEAQAAKLYWHSLFGPEFRRHGPQAPNSLLNYGYTVLLSCVMRALVGSGLHPALGIQHRNSQNPYCLASDLMEAFRPFVDLLVAHMYYQWEIEDLNPAVKRTLSQLLRLEWGYAGEQSSLSRNVQRYVWQFARCVEQDKSPSTSELPAPPLLGAEILESVDELCGLILTK